MEKKQVISRMSQESYDRLQELSKKYGVSSSGLLALLVNERWLKEKEVAVKALEKPQEENQNSARTRKSRPRQKSKKS
jgi:predicted DNA-binding protein